MDETNDNTKLVVVEGNSDVPTDSEKEISRAQKKEFWTDLIQEVLSAVTAETCDVVREHTTRTRFDGKPRKYTKE